MVHRISPAVCTFLCFFGFHCDGQGVVERKIWSQLAVDGYAQSPPPSSSLAIMMLASRAPVGWKETIPHYALPTLRSSRPVMIIPRKVPGGSKKQEPAASTASTGSFRNPFSFPKNDKPAAPEWKPNREQRNRQFTLDDLGQLMTMGAGAPSLGKLKKVNFDKPEAEGGATFQFEIQANNFKLDKAGDIVGLEGGEYIGPDGYIRQRTLITVAPDDPSNPAWLRWILKMGLR